MKHKMGVAGKWKGGRSRFCDTFHGFLRYVVMFEADALLRLFGSLCPGAGWGCWAVVCAMGTRVC